MGKYSLAGNEKGALIGASLSKAPLFPSLHSPLPPPPPHTLLTSDADCMFRARKEEERRGGLLSGYRQQQDGWMALCQTQKLRCFLYYVTTTYLVGTTYMKGKRHPIRISNIKTTADITTSPPPSSFSSSSSALRQFRHFVLGEWLDPFSNVRFIQQDFRCPPPPFSSEKRGLHIGKVARCCRRFV